MDKKYPIKLEEKLTQACHDLHVSQSVSDVKAVVSDLQIFEEHKYQIPEWLDAWIKLSLKNPILTGEEHYKMRKPFMFPDPTDSEKESFRICEAYDKRQTQKVQHAIHSANCFSPNAKQDCAFMIAARMFWNQMGSDAGGSLATEWHFSSDCNYSLEEPHNYRLLVKILRRETDFWHDGMKPNAWKKPRLQPIYQTI